MPNRPNHPAAITILYASAFYQGLALIILAASASVLKEVKGFSDAQYGLLFMPQLVTTLIGSLASGVLARRWGLKLLLGLALASMALSQALMAVAVLLLPHWPAFYTVLAAIAVMGLGFGFNAAPLNTYPGLLFERKGAAALVAVHTAIAFGIACGPLLIGPLIKAALWWVYPLSLMAVGALLLLALALGHPPVYGVALTAGTTPKPLGSAPNFSSSAALFCAIAFFYAVAEGIFSNWIIIYLHEDHTIPLAWAALALSAFWAGLACGRLLVSVLLLRIKAEKFWLLLPLLMIAAFILLPLVRGALSAILLFAFAGLACSALFPITMGLFSQRFPDQAAQAAAFMSAAGMAGVSIGTFIIGPLRSVLPLAHLYLLSAIYPGVVLLLVVWCLLKQKRR